MNRKYVWESYDWKGNHGLENLKYCSACGTKCIQKKEGDRKRPTCPACGFVFYKNPSPGVVVVIEKENKILLGRRAEGSFQSGKWCLPGGFVEFDEDFLTSAIREAKEETHLDIEIQSILNVSTIFHSADLHALVVVLAARIVSGTPTPGDDLDKLQWFPIGSQLPEMAFSADADFIERYDELKNTYLPVNTPIKV